LFVVLDVVDGILAAQVEIVGSLVFGFRGGKFDGRNAERREQALFQRRGDVVVESEDVGCRNIEGSAPGDLLFGDVHSFQCDADTAIVAQEVAGDDVGDTELARG
jgi:hypothetical protein